MSQQSAKLFRSFDDPALRAFERQQSAAASEAQSRAALAQRAADAVRKEIDRRKRQSQSGRG